MRRYEAYKDSGIPWIGSIPSHWEAYRLRFVCELRNGYTPSKAVPEYWKNGTIPWYRMDDIRQYGRKLQEANQYITEEAVKGGGLFSAGSFILATTATIGEHAQLIVDSLANQRFTNLRIRESYAINKVSAEYFFYYLFIIDDYCKTTTRLSTFPAVNINDLRNFIVLVPPLREQVAIAGYLQAKTEKIEEYISLRVRQRELLEELRQAEVAHAVTHGLNPNAPMKDSGIPWLGNIPKHWEVKRLSLKFHENKTQNSNLEVTEAYRFNYGTLVRKDEGVDVSELADTYSKYTILNPDDIVINCLNLNYDLVSQRVAIAEHRGIITSAYLTIVPRKNVSAKYYLHLFKAMDSMKLFHGMGTGIRLTLSYAELKKQYIPVPPLSEQAAIVDYIESRIALIDRQIASLSLEIEYMQEFQQRLISDAVTGQIKVIQ